MEQFFFRNGNIFNQTVSLTFSLLKRKDSIPTFFCRLLKYHNSIYFNLEHSILAKLDHKNGKVFKYKKIVQYDH